MKNECGAVRDLMPLYRDHLVSKETAAFIEEHLETCEECRKLYRQEQEDLTGMAESEDTVPLTKFAAMFQKKKRETILLFISLACTVLLSLFSWLSAPEFLNASQAVASVHEDTETVSVQFTERVHHYRIDRDPDGGTDIQCWTTVLDSLFETHPSYSVSLEKGNIWYLNNYRSFDARISGDTLLYGETEYEDGRWTLPRLALNFWLLVSVGLSALLGILWFIFRRKPWGSRVRDLFLIPLSWTAADLIVERGIGSTTFSLMRDFTWIVLIAVFLFFTLYLGVRRMENRKVSKENADF
jgi:hypothetical protein